MVRLLFVVFLIGMCIGVSGQGVAIPKSTDIIVIRGKSFYLHTVQPGQTLYSICKTYGVDVEEVKALNEKKDNSLSLYEVLKVPYVEPFVQQDDKYYYHRVLKGETLYSIARQYNMKPKRLLKFNSDYSENHPLAVGAVVRLPLSEISRSSIVKPIKEPEVAVKPETLTELDQQEGESQKSDVTLQVVPPTRNQEAGAKDTLPVSAYEEIRPERKKEMPGYIPGVILPSDPFVKVALLLPFSANDYPLFIDSLGVQQSVSISARSEQFISFYEGVLLAVDSLKKQGYKIDLHVFDTQRNSEKMYEITEQLNRLNPALIIGPVYGSVFKTMAENLENKSIPIVYPLSSRSESFGEYPNFIQVNASFDVLAAKMLEWLKLKGKNANIIHIGFTGATEAEWTEKRAFEEKMRQIDGVNFFDWNVDEVPLELLRPLLLPDRENIIVLPTSREAEVSKILPLLSALADGYQITVLGLPEWQTYTSVDHETFYKLNTKLFTYSYVDYTSPEALALAEKYRKYFYTEPTSLVYKAFDMGLYFIELAARYRDWSLEAIEYYEQTRGCSKFNFEKMSRGLGRENHGFYIVNYGSDYHLKLEAF